MVSKNNRIEKMQQVAERQSHFGIRKLTIGAASVLLGTTLWLGTNANVTHAEDNNANDSGDADQAQKSESSASSIDSNTKVVVAPSNNQNTNANSLKSDVSVSTNSKTDLQNQAANQSSSNKNASSVKANISATTSNNASTVTENAPATNTSAKTTADNTVNNKSAANNTGKTVTSSLTKTSEEAKTVSDAQNQNAVKQSAKEVTQNNINQAANAGKSNVTAKKGLDLSKLDLSEAEQKAALKTDPALKAQEKLANAINANQNASHNNEVTTLSIKAGKDETIDAKQLGASLVGGTGLAGLNDGRNDSGKVDRVLVAKSSTDNVVTKKATIDSNVGLSGKQDATNNSYEAMKMGLGHEQSTKAPISELLASLDQVPNSSSEKNDAVTSWQGVEDAYRNNATSVTVSGNITADSNLSIASGKTFTINGEKGAFIDFGKNVINLNDGDTLTLSNVTISSDNAGGAIVSNDDKNVINFDNVTDTKNSLFNGKGQVHIQGTVKTTVADNSLSGTVDQQGIPNDGNTWSNSAFGKTLAWANAALISQYQNRKVPNIYASNLNIDDGATLDIERTADGDGIVLRDGVNAPSNVRRVMADWTGNGKINVGNNAKLTINLKNSGMRDTDIINEQKKNLIENLNAGIRVNNTGSLTSDSNAIITINAGTGRGIVFSTPNRNMVPSGNDNYVDRAQAHGGTTHTVKGVTINDDMWSSQNPKDGNPGFKNTFKLGKNNTFNLTGRDGFILGHDTTFNTGAGSNISVKTYGCGNGLTMGDFSTFTVDNGSTIDFESEGKNAGGDFQYNNYIMLGEDGKISVKKDATLRVILTGRGYYNYNDDISIDSQYGHNPEIYVGNNATLDVRSDEAQGNAELIGIPLPGPDGSQSIKFILDNVKYVNLQKTAKTKGLTLAPGLPSGMADALSKQGYPTSADGYGDLIFMDIDSNHTSTGRNAHFEAYGDLAAFKWNNADLSSNNIQYDPNESVSQNYSKFEKSAAQTWSNMYGFDIPYQGFSQGRAGSVWIDPSGSTAGTNINSNHGVAFSDAVKGFSPYMSQRLVIIGHSLQPVQEQRTVHYVVQDVDKNGNPIETDPTQMREIANPYVQNAQGDNAQSYELYKDNATDQLVQIERNSDGTPKLDNGNVIPVRDSNGNYVSDGTNVNWSTTDGSIVKGSDGHYYFKSYQAPAEITGVDGNGNTVESLDGGYYQLATADQLASITTNSGEVVKNGTVANSKDFAGSTKDFKSGNYYNTYKDGNLYVVYRAAKKQNHLAADISKVTISRTIERDVVYKNNSTTGDANGQAKYDITDPNGTDRDKASQLIDMKPGQLIVDSSKGEADKAKQTITLIGTAYYDKTTGKFIKVNDAGYAVDAQGRYITYDEDGNTVVGQLVNGKLEVKLDDQGNEIPTDYVQGSFTWSANSDQAKGWNAPDANGYSKNPSRVTNFTLNTPTNAQGITDENGKAISNPTVQQVLNYLNREAKEDANKPAVAEDTIKDATDYPSRVNPALAQLFPQLTPDKGSQYIFDQFRLTDKNDNNLNYVVTLASDRNNPTGAVHVYITNPDYTHSYMERTCYVEDGNDPLYFNDDGTADGLQFRISVSNWDGDYGNSVSVDVNNGFNLRRTFGYGARPKDVSASWGDYKPREVTQTIKYVDDKTNAEIRPQVQVKGLIGQSFDASGVLTPTIFGYTPASDSDKPSGSISDYQVNKTYTRTWQTTVDGNTYRVIEHHKLLSDKGTMDTTVTVQVYDRYMNLIPGETQTKEEIIPAGQTMTDGPHEFEIQNPWVPSTSTVTLRYQKKDMKAEANPYYVVYTPEEKSSLVVKFHDDTDNVDIPTFGGKTIGFTSGQKKPGDSVGYNDSTDLKSLTDNGYVYVDTLDSNGKAVTIPTTIPTDPETIIVHVRHKVTPVTPDTPTPKVPSNTPDWAKPDHLTKKVTRTITYINNDGTTFNGAVPTNAKETLEFDGTAYIDVVNGHVVTVKSTTPDAQGNYEIADDTNNQDNITWTAKNGNSFSAVTSPNETGYHVTSVSSHADSTGKNVAAIDGITKDSSKITIEVRYDKDDENAQKAHLRIFDDTTGKTLNDSISAEGKQGTAIDFVGGENIVDGYLNSGYKFVSVASNGSGWTAKNDIIADATQGQSYSDANFSRFDTDKTQDQYFTVHLAHKIDTIDVNHPHDQKVTATVTRKVSYTVDGLPDSGLPSHIETVTFNAIGHYDEVEHKVVDVKDGKEQVTNGVVNTGTLKWTYSLNGGASQDGSTTQFAGYKVPTKAGYHVNNVTVDPASDKNANADDTGLVKDLSVNTNSHNVTININLTKNPVSDVVDTVIYVDETEKNKALKTDSGNDLKSLSGSQGDKITYITAPIIADYVRQGYVFDKSDFHDNQEIFGSKGRTYYVYLKHGTKHVDHNTPGNGYSSEQLQHTATTNVTYVDQNNNAIAGLNPVHNTVTITGEGDYDTVTDQWVHKNTDGTLTVVPGPTWTYTVNKGKAQSGQSTTLPAIDAKKPAGYTYAYTSGSWDNNLNVNQNDGSIGQQTVNMTTGNSNIVIHFNKNNEPPVQDDNADLRIIDQDDSNSVLDSFDDHDKPNQNITFTKNTNNHNYEGTNTLQSWLDKGYEFVKAYNDADNNSIGAVTVDAKTGKITKDTISFGTYKNSKQNFTIVLKHSYSPVNPNHPHNGVDPSEYEKDVKSTIHYIYSDGRTAAPDNVQNAKWTRTITIDNVTGHIVPNGKLDTQWVANIQNYDAVVSPTINGYTPDKSTVAAKKVTQYDLEETVIYNPVKDAQSAGLRIVDQDENNQVLNTYAGSGKSDSNISFSGYNADVINNYIQRGYIVVGLTNDNNSAVEASMSGTDATKWNFGKYDHNDNISQNFTITLKHGTRPVDPQHPVDPKHPVDPNHPNNPNNKNPQPGLSETDLEKTVTRTFHYVFTDGSSHPDITEAQQKVTFTGKGIIDLVTGKLVDPSGKGEGVITWTVDPANSTLPAVAVKPVNGYHVVGEAAVNSNPDGSVSKQQVDRNSSNIDVTVVYAPDQTPVAGDQLAHLRVIDNNDPNHQVELTHFDNSGKEGTVIDFTGSKQALDGYIRAGYVFQKAVNDSNQASIGSSVDDLAYGNYDNNSKVTQNFTVYLVHGTKPATPDNPNGVDPKQLTDTTTATVHYVIGGNNTNKPTAPADHVQIITWTRHLTVDSVTGKLIPAGKYDTDWQPSANEYNSVITPVVNGYTADKGEAIFTTPVRGTNPHITITYLPNGHVVPVDPNGKTIPGTNTSQYQPQFPTNPKDPTKTTSSYVPTIPGYHPQKGKTGDPVNPGNKPTDNVTVIYVPDNPTEQGSVTINVHNDTTNSDLPDYGYKTGKVDEGTTVNYANHDDQIKDLVNKGYVIVSDPYANGDVTKTVPGNDDLTYTIHVKDGIKPVNPTNKPGTPVDPNNPNGPKYPNDYNTSDLQKSVTRTIEYVDGNGNQIHESFSNTVNFTGTRYFDEVTGKWTDADGNECSDQSKPITVWSADQTLEGQKSPVIIGYVLIGVNKSTEQHNDSSDGLNVDDVSVDHTASDYTVQVVYNQIGKIVPVDPNGNPIPGASQPKYHNDPTDPTKVIPNEPIPDVPGWTPDNSNPITPTDPTKDTPVFYHKTGKPITPPNPYNPTPSTPSTTPEPNPPTPTSKPTSPTQPTTAPTPSTPHKPAKPVSPAGPKNHGGTHTSTPAPTPTPTSHRGNNTPRPTAPSTGYNYNNNPHGENGSWSTNNPPISETTPTGNGSGNGNGGNVGPNGQTLPNGDTIMPNGEVVDPNGRVVGFVDKNGQVHYTLPQTGENQGDNLAAALAGGAAVAIGLIGLAGVKRRRD